jgi:hypothetical protein
MPAVSSVTSYVVGVGQATLTQGSMENVAGPFVVSAPCTVKFGSGAEPPGNVQST